MLGKSGSGSGWKVGVGARVPTYLFKKALPFLGQFPFILKNKKKSVEEMIL